MNTETALFYMRVSRTSHLTKTAPPQANTLRIRAKPVRRYGSMLRWLMYQKQRHNP